MSLKGIQKLYHNTCTWRTIQRPR